MHRSIIAMLALLVTTVAFAVPGMARAAAGAPFRLPYRAGTAHLITTSPGVASHADAYNLHAVDFAMPTGTPVLASAGGRVHFEGWASGGGGIMVLIDHGNNLCSQYAHLNSTVINQGQWVAQGQQVGTAGATGTATGPHLHWNLVSCTSQLSAAIPNTVERGTSYPIGIAPVSQNGGAPTTHEVGVSDFSGDGAADLLVISTAGNLWWYPNNKLQLSDGRRIGHGWQTFRHAMAADWSGDGAADVLGVAADGTLWYYPNNNYTLSAPVRVGHGWGTFRHVMAADWSGDGKADVLAVSDDGRLWYYPHQGAGLGTPVQLGHGWGGFRFVTAADWSGDGHADVLAVDTNGRLWYYPHQGAGLGTPVQLGHGWGGFRHVWSADFTGDRYSDMLAEDSSGRIWLYPHQGSGFGTPRQVGKLSGTDPKVF